MASNSVPVLLVTLMVGHMAHNATCCAQSSEVGEVSFANSGAPEAQTSFLYGLGQLHNFEYRSAAEAFRAAQEADPDFALAYWGEAMTYNHPIWMEQDADAARAVLRRLGDTPDARLAKAPTEREKDWLRAVEVLYEEGDKHERDFAYAEAMARLHRKYPDDPDAAAFYALAILGTAHEGRDFSTYMKAAAVAEGVFQKHRRHPGALHYMIHSYDDPIHAPLGLRAARTYAKVAPAAAHAQHMTSHIFVAMGMWDDVVMANETASAVVNRGLKKRGQPPRHCGHYNFWLLYGYTQQGRRGDAKARLAACRQDALAARGEPVLDPDRGNLHSFLQMRARYLVDTEEWNGEVATWETDLAPEYVPERVTQEFTQGFVAARRGDLESLERRLDGLRQARRDLEAFVEENADESGPAVLARGAILELELEAMLARANGNPKEAIALLRRAAEKEEELPLFFGPPFVDKPSRELLGELLLEAGRAEDAVAAFEKALARTPERTATLAGLAKATALTGDEERAADTRQQLRQIWHRADRVAKE